MLNFRLTAQHAKARCGVINGHASNSISVHTPCMTDITTCGAFVHLTEDIVTKELSHVTGRITQLNMFDFLNLVEVVARHNQSQDTPLSFAKYINAQRQNQIMFCTTRPPLHVTTLPCSNDEATGLTTAGHRKLTPESHIEAIKTMSPHWFVCLSDEAGANDSSNRKKKCVERSISWLDRSLKRCEAISVSPQTLFACVQGTDNLRDRIKSATEMAKRDVAGFVIGGLWRGESPDLRAQILSAVAEIIPQNKPRFVPGAMTPLEILDAISRGYDIFEGSYALHLTQNGSAMTFPTEMSNSTKRRKVTDTEKVATHSQLQQQSKIQLRDKSYALDETAVVEGCQCYTCRNHTKAYLHHLVICQEMTGDILLDIHNIHHMDLWMTSVRKSIQSNQFDEFVEWFKDSLS